MTTMPVTPDLPRTRAKLGTKSSIKSLVAFASLLGGCAATTLAQAPTTVILPPSSIPGAANAGVRAHTHLQMLSTKFTGTPNSFGPPVGPGLFYETPASIACIYGFRLSVAGCNPYAVGDANPNPGIVQFHLTPMSGRAEAATRIRLGGTGTVTVLAKTSTGKLYAERKVVKVTVGGCGG